MEIFLASFAQGLMVVVLIASIFVILVVGKDLILTKDWKKDQ